MFEQKKLVQNLHQGQPVRTAGEAQHAECTVMMVHGRYARTEDILSLTGPLKQPGFAYFAPPAANNTWNPNRFLAPIESNEPWLSSALARLTFPIKWVV